MAIGSSVSGARRACAFSRECVSSPSVAAEGQPSFPVQFALEIVDRFAGSAASPRSRPMPTRSLLNRVPFNPRPSPRRSIGGGALRATGGRLLMTGTGGLRASRARVGISALKASHPSSTVLEIAADRIDFPGPGRAPDRLNRTWAAVVLPSGFQARICQWQRQGSASAGSLPHALSTQSGATMTSCHLQGI